MLLRLFKAAGDWTELSQTLNHTTSQVWILVLQ